MTDPDLPGDRREEPAPVAGAATPGTGPMLADPGGYEIRFRLAGWVALAPPFGILCLGVGILPDPFYLRLIFIALGAFFTVPYAIMLANRTIVFRADQAGITLGPEMIPTVRFGAVFFPWADIKKITFYKITRMSEKQSLLPGTYLAIVTHDRVPEAGEARRISTWRLDRQRLADLTAVAAPGVRIVDAGKIDPVTDTGQAVLRELGR